MGTSPQLSTAAQCENVSVQSPSPIVHDTIAIARTQTFGEIRFDPS